MEYDAALKILVSVAKAYLETNEGFFDEELEGFDDTVKAAILAVIDDRKES